MSTRNATTAAHCIKQSSTSFDSPFQKLIQTIANDETRVWNSIEIHSTYVLLGGVSISRRDLLDEVAQNLGNRILILRGSGIASLLLFRVTAVKLLKITDDDDDDSQVIKKMSRKIKQDCECLAPEQNYYSTRIDRLSAEAAGSQTCLTLMRNLNSNPSCGMKSIFVANVVTNIVTNRPTSLQIALGVILRRKSIIEQFHRLGICCSYDELLRFKTSAAVSVANTTTRRQIFSAKEGLVQVVIDNFDANISSQNGLRSTHALAMLVTQSKLNSTDDTQLDEQIRRVNKNEMKSNLNVNITTHFYSGPKKPLMPSADNKKHQVLSLKCLATQFISLQRCKVIDTNFLRDIISTDITQCPEYNGYNTKICLSQGHTVRPPTTATYMPLIDMVPSDPSTVLTAMIEAQRVSTECGQLHTIITADQQLYKVIVQVQWVYPHVFPNLIPRLGGMHTLMNFIGCVGTLMTGSGLEDVLKSAFGGVPRMLSGKNFPQNARALRLVVEELLRGSIDNCASYDTLINNLECNSEVNRMRRHWLDNLVKPVLLMMIYVRAEREADWLLHLWALKAMLPYFFAAGHINYARYGLYYFRSMQNLPAQVQDSFMRGEHVMRHNPGLWNGIWSDMFIESTFMRYGHEDGGIIGITLKPSALKKWALSLHLCTRLKGDVLDMVERTTDRNVIRHKEEEEGRITADGADREKIRLKLQACIDPFNPPCDSNELINISTGRISPQSVNVDNSLLIGQKQMHDYEADWPASFSNTISSKVKTMSHTVKEISIGTNIVPDPETIYSRMMILASERDIAVKDVMNYELSAAPTSIFDENGNMRIPKAKYVLRKKLQVEVSNRCTMNPNVIILDGCAIMWALHWPVNGTVNDFISGFLDYVYNRLQQSDVFVVFDRYYEYSIKSTTRSFRSTSVASRRHILTEQTPLPSQHVVLSVTQNKKQLISIICERLIANAMQWTMHSGHRVVVTGEAETPTMVCQGIISQLDALTTTHEEADVIMVHQMAHAASEGAAAITIVSDDTDVFVLLMHFYMTLSLTCQVVMEGTSPKRTSTDIGACSLKHSNIAPHIMAAHALSGCDTVAHFCNVGKGIVFKVLSNGYELSKLGVIEEDFDEVLNEATSFIGACYGSKCQTSMSDIRFDIWTKKMGNRKATTAPKLRSLPPTTEAFAEHVKRAHFQMSIWRAAIQPNPPPLDPLSNGWWRDESNKTLMPIMLPRNVLPVPESVSKLIRCVCASNHLCSTARCGCKANRLSCTTFCACKADSKCENEVTRMSDSDSDSEDDDDSED